MIAANLVPSARYEYMLPLFVTYLFTNKKAYTDFEIDRLGVASQSYRNHQELLLLTNLHEHLSLDNIFPNMHS